MIYIEGKVGGVEKVTKKRNFYRPYFFLVMRANLAIIALAPAPWMYNLGSHTGLNT